MTSIPVANPHARYERYADEIDAAVLAALRSGRYIKDARVAAFEKEFASYCGAKECVGVANGTDAIYYALRALGIGSGDEVLTVSHTAVATVAAIELLGAVPVLVDIDPATRGMDPKQLPSLLSPKTKAIVPVHIYGQPVEIEAICGFARENNLLVVEDCAQAHGAKVGTKRVGTFGDAAAFSFYPTKNLGCFGDGGAVVTNSTETAESARLLTQYGWKERYLSDVTGGNSRLDEIHAGVLSVLLRHLDSDNERRREIAARYAEACVEVGICCPLPVDGTESVYHLFVVQLEDPERGAFREWMQSQGVGTALHYPYAVHHQPAYKGRLKGSDRLPETDSLYASLVTLPMFPELSDDDVAKTCDAIRRFEKS